MFEVREKPEVVERALLVRIYCDPREEAESASLLEELAELVDTLGIGIVDSVLVRTREQHKRFICGTGKATEIVDLAKAHECDVIVFDNMLAPSQQREPVKSEALAQKRPARGVDSDSVEDARPIRRMEAN